MGARTCPRFSWGRRGAGKEDTTLGVMAGVKKNPSVELTGADLVSFNGHELH